jgi:hypothetical protein
MSSFVLLVGQGEFMDIQFPIISQVLKLYNGAKEEASIKLEEVADNRTLPGMKARKNIGASMVEELTLKLRELIETDSVAIFPLGTEANQKSFSQLVSEEDENAITLDADTMYKVLASAIESFLGPERKFTVETGRALQASLSKMATSLRLMSYVMPHVHQFYNQSIPTLDELTTVVKQLVRASNGDILNAAYISYRVFESIVSKDYDANVVAVVILNASEEEAKGDLAVKIFGGRSVAVDVKKKPDHDMVVSIAKKIRPLYQRVAPIIAEFNKTKS